jgi:phosphoribosylamine--glycine ligase/phosphoribosylformylglycinamidine cyclo-ligase
MIETSMSFARDLMREHKIPRPRGGTCSTYDHAFHVWKHLDEIACLVDGRGPEAQIVIKADGKDTFFPKTKEQAIEKFGELLPDSASRSGNRIVYEELLKGKEISVLSFSDGKHYKRLPHAQVHKGAYNGDLGAKTKEMGCIAPSPILICAGMRRQIDKIINGTFEALKKRGTRTPTIL